MRTTTERKRWARRLEQRKKSRKQLFPDIFLRNCNEQIRQVTLAPVLFLHFAVRSISVVQFGGNNFDDLVERPLHRTASYQCATFRMTRNAQSPRRSPHHRVVSSGPRSLHLCPKPPRGPTALCFAARQEKRSGRHHEVELVLPPCALLDAPSPACTEDLRSNNARVEYYGSQPPPYVIVAISLRIEPCAERATLSRRTFGAVIDRRRRQDSGGRVTEVVVRSSSRRLAAQMNKSE
ncbi:hypothetical protein NECAME_01394 [Necator americanus]|uniref:Uncharacterized protein n=1 Tax=Necator americanus TaxID=51031 RepID=W2TTV0_NECAM|nr:hypothetical protein NECAME_01394 [Necator americanus]ETN85505.1 hypothetical protein NECAME_01394 [Necator americanus]